METTTRLKFGNKLDCEETRSDEQCCRLKAYVGARSSVWDSEQKLSRKGEEPTKERRWAFIRIAENK